MQPGPLLLLLAVHAVASQPGVTLSQQILTEPQTVNISSCPIRFYGRLYSLANVSFGINSSVSCCFKNDPTEIVQDCVIFHGIDDVNTTIVILQSLNGNDFPALENNRTHCFYVFSFRGEGTEVNMAFVNSDQFTILTMAPNLDLNVTLTVGDSTVNTLSIKNGTNNVDVSACRVGGFFARRGSEVLDPETCTTIYCNTTVFASSVSSCGPKEVCLGNNKCVKPLPVCTVTGSTVIDFFGRLHSVPDRCAYALVEIQGSSRFTIRARFRERRRRDVALLDYLEITWWPSSLILHQGGRVERKGKIIKLTNTTQLIDGVEFSMDHTGVTVKMPSSNVTLFFDGNTAHVTSSPTEEHEGLWGLCGSLRIPERTTTVDDKRFPFIDFPSCMTQNTDAFDSTINCNRSTEHCNLMRQAPFTACHSHISPEPYITACTNTLCSYPAVDALNCRLLEAYVKACSMGNIAVGEWRSMAGCSDVPQDFCQDHDCSPHEFCGEILGTTGCLCRALFASRYKPTNALGEPTVCRENSATVTLAVCLLLDRGIDHSVLHLKDPSCTGHMDDDHMLTFSFNSSNTCGMEVLTNDSQLIYKNTIRGLNSSTSVITRHDQVLIDFSCSYTMPDVRRVSFRIKDSAVVQQIVSGVWNYTLMMSAYTDAGHMNLVMPSTEIQLNQKIWMELKTEGLDGNMVSIVTDSCWATNQRSSSSRVRYDLIINKCSNPADHTVSVEENGQGTSSSFSFNMFEFSGGSNEIYLHCQVELCPQQGPSCVPSCSGSSYRKRRSFRSKRDDRNPSALITMTWTK